jgi:hypothetical protein
MAVAFAARIALRVLPSVQNARSVKRSDFPSDFPAKIVLPVFSATSTAWVAAKYPAHARKASVAAAEVASAAAADLLATTITRMSEKAANAETARKVAAAAVLKAAAAAANAANAPNAAPAFAAIAADEAPLAAAFKSSEFSSIFPNFHSALWSAISFDAKRVDEGAPTSVIADMPLWPEGQPDAFRSLWQELEQALLAANENWHVWINWYRDRLEGRVREEESELAFVRVEEALWDQGPAIVNAEIIRLAGELLVIENVPADNPPFGAVQSSSAANAILEAWQPVNQPPQHGVHHLQAASITTGPASVGSPSIRVAEPTPPPKPSRRKKQTSPGPDIPPQRPAALEPVWSNGKLVLPSKHARTDGDIKALSAALKVLRAGIIELADDTESEPSNFDKRVVPYLRRIGERIPDHRPSQEELFRLAHIKEFLEAYSNTANEEWPNHLATRLHLLVRHFDLTVRQFPKWREFVRNAQQNRLTAEQATEVPAITEAMVKALRDEDAQEFIDPAIAQALENLQAPDGESAIGGGIVPIKPGQLLLADDIVESMNNIAKEVVVAALADASDGRAPSITKRKKTVKGIGATAEAAVSVYVVEAEKSVIKEAKRLGKETGPAITRWVKRLVLGSGVGGGTAVGYVLAHHLIHAFPDKFQWLQPLLAFFS